MIRISLSALLLGWAAMLPLGAQSPDSYHGETKEQKDQRMKWWREARFGMFIHWGVYAVPAGVYEGQGIAGIGEWIMNRGKIPVARYREYAKDFNPVKYDPENWVTLAKEAGMKYIIITAKHHDGFALFDSKVSDWDIADATPYKKDLLKPLAEACRKHGMKLGFYYSQAQDWIHKGGACAGGEWDASHKGSMDEYLKTIAIPQIREILENYGDIAVIWFDTPTNMTPARAEMILPLLKEHPGIIYNNRLGGGYKGDTETPEQHIPATGFPNRDWETCMTMNGTWGFKSKDHDWKSTETLVRNLIDIASKGGNYLLNVGPTAEGEIPSPSIDRLKQIASWMKVNGESIHGTTASPFRRLLWGRCTVKKGKTTDTFYLHIFDWPQDGKLNVPGFTAKVSQARVLGGETASVTTTKNGSLAIDVGMTPIDPIATVVAIDVAHGWEVRTVTLSPATDGNITLGTETVELHQTGTSNHIQIETAGGKTNVGYWTNPANWIGWAFHAPVPEKYEIVAETSSAAGTSLAVGLAGTTKTVSIPPTHDYSKYQTHSLGVFNVPAGDQEISLQAVSENWQPINVRSVVLKPAK